MSIATQRAHEAAREAVVSTEGARNGGPARKGEGERELESAAQFMAQERVGASVLVRCSGTTCAGKTSPLSPPKSSFLFFFF